MEGRASGEEKTTPFCMEDVGTRTVLRGKGEGGADGWRRVNPRSLMRYPQSVRGFPSPTVPGSPSTPPIPSNTSRIGLAGRYIKRRAIG